ncbi:phage protein GemA/Gp16 family protein [Ethanoligenens harbinense]|uniref:Regulatory protein GemA n=1 Tax=Ethanoligenens harbinense (strain DSM 18485 / JCM 12961 / CGMCC 1.5033 / YUAN-3) TaxID=663278 RepID=E6U928_ETHHY|nr:phage protein GemA/Gp16 family protein [Ethanoligenens harbinense]ADU26092.1 hypothetical protein Ethha_0507 [Ethanoligenens harbinense YUAN-3]
MNITKQQIKSIYALGAGLHIVGRGHDDELHALVDGLTGKESITALDRDEAQRVIAELMRRMRGTPPVPPARKKPRHYEEAPGGITADQQRKVWALMYELKKIRRQAGGRCPWRPAVRDHPAAIRHGLHRKKADAVSGPGRGRRTD